MNKPDIPKSKAARSLAAMRKHPAYPFRDDPELASRAGAKAWTDERRAKVRKLAEERRAAKKKAQDADTAPSA